MTSHHFQRSILREYDIRGIVGETLFEADANGSAAPTARSWRVRWGARRSSRWDATGA
jgi:phosphomannomutase